jgi:hypothetical protein
MVDSFGEYIQQNRSVWNPPLSLSTRIAWDFSPEMVSSQHEIELTEEFVVRPEGNGPCLEKTSVALVRERTIPTERQLAGEVSANFFADRG